MSSSCSFSGWRARSFSPSNLSRHPSSTSSRVRSRPGCCPAIGLVLVLTEFRHFIDVQPPFPSTPFMLHIVLILAAVGVALSVALTRISLRPSSAQLGPSTSADRLPSHRAQIGQPAARSQIDQASHGSAPTATASALSASPCSGCWY